MEEKMETLIHMTPPDNPSVHDILVAGFGLCD